jgi:hypothetical protein
VYEIWAKNSRFEGKLMLPDVLIDGAKTKVKVIARNLQKWSVGMGQITGSTGCKEALMSFRNT